MKGERLFASHQMLQTAFAIKRPAPLLKSFYQNGATAMFALRLLRLLKKQIMANVVK
jgi:hypothetical protein